MSRWKRDEAARRKIEADNKTFSRAAEREQETDPIGARMLRWGAQATNDILKKQYYNVEPDDD